MISHTSQALFTEELLMNTVREITITRELVTEKEQIWQEHIKVQKESGLSRKAYCVKHHLNYDQFGYWVNKWRQQQPIPKLLPVHLNRPAPKPVTLCTLVFKNGAELKVHDQSILPLLHSIWG